MAELSNTKDRFLDRHHIINELHEKSEQPSLIELERRQDDVLAQLDELDKKLTSILRGLGVTLVEDQEAKHASIRLAELDDSESDGAELEDRSADHDDFKASKSDQATRQPSRRHAA